MAQEQVNGILQGLVLAQQRRTQNAKLAQDQQQEQDLQTFRQQQIDDAKNALAEHGRQFDITSKAAKALFDLHRLEAEQKITAGIQQGFAVPGAQITGTRSDPNSGDYNTYQLPLNDDSGNPMSVELPTPLTHARQQAQISQIEQAPITQGKIDVANAANTAKLEQIKTGKNFDLDRQREHERAENFRAAAHNNAILEAAKLRQKAGDPSMGDLSPYIEDLSTGNISVETVKKEQPKAAPQIFAATLKSGAKPLTQAQIDGVKDFTNIINVVPIMDDFINHQPDHTTKVGGFIGGVGQLADADQKGRIQETQAVIPGITRKMSGLGTNRLNKPEIEFGKGGFIPDMFAPKSVNIDKRNKFVKLAKKMIDIQLDGLPQGQKSLIKAKLGLDKIDDDFSTGQNTPTPSAAPTNAPSSPNDDVINGILGKYTK